jgi:hypothetical protein
VQRFVRRDWYFTRAEVRIFVSTALFSRAQVNVLNGEGWDFAAQWASGLGKIGRPSMRPGRRSAQP